MFFDFHIHSKHSFDSYMSIGKIIEVAKKKGLSGIAITDHNNFGNKNEIVKHKSGAILIVPGMEIATDIGDVIGLFIKEEIRGNKFDEVVKAIKDQDAIVVMPHPYHRHSILSEQILSRVDVIEVFNARCNEEQNQKALILSKERNLPQIAGSDAHLYNEIGMGKVFYENVKNLDDLKRKMLNSFDMEFQGNITLFRNKIITHCVRLLKTGDLRVFIRFIKASLIKQGKDNANQE